MELNAEQQKKISDWVADGMGLSDIQRNLESEFEITMTYMDVRFLIIDLGLEIKDKNVPKKKEETVKDEPEEKLANSAVSIEVDRLIKPGALVSGSVTFSDSVTATWLIDQQGRLALDPGIAGYRPSEDDLMAFQNEIKAALEKKGF